jgi:hypothetical protein
LQGYAVMEDTPIVDNQPCFYYNPANDIPYAFILSPALLSQRLPISSIQPMAQPVLAYQRLSDTIGVAVAGTRAEQLLLVQENAYPGWQVTVNAQPAKLEVGGGLMGVMLPAAPGEVLEVVFAYRPPLVYVGGVITILSAVVCIFWLLRVDRWIYRR